MNNKRKNARISACFVLALSICIGMVGCNLRSDYKLLELDGKHYLVFDDIFLYFNPSVDIAYHDSLATDMSFDSLKQFKGIVTGGALTTAQKKRVAQFAKDKEYRIPICDFDNLYYPIIPDGNALEKVEWDGDEYLFQFEIENVLKGTIYLQTDEAYLESYKAKYEKFFDASSMSLVDKVYDEISNQEIIYYTSVEKDDVWYRSFKRVRYSLEDDDKIFYIDKVFLIDTNVNYDMGKISSTIPYGLTLYCEEDGQKYTIDFGRIKEDPSDEWLIKFGIQKYVDKK